MERNTIDQMKNIEEKLKELSEEIKSCPKQSHLDEIRNEIMMLADYYVHKGQALRNSDIIRYEQENGC